MKVFLLSFMVLGGSLLLANQQQSIYEQLSLRPSEVTVDELRDALREHPDLLGCTSEDAPEVSLMHSFVRAKNRRVVMAGVKAFMNRKALFNGKTGKEAIDEVIEGVEDEAMKKLILRTAGKKNVANKQKPQSQVIANKPNLFSFRKLLGVAGVSLVLYSGWKLYQHCTTTSTE